MESEHKAVDDLRYLLKQAAGAISGIPGNHRLCNATALLLRSLAEYMYKPDNDVSTIDLVQDLIEVLRLRTGIS